MSELVAKLRRFRPSIPLRAAAIFLSVAAISTFIQWEPKFRDPDSFYHAKMAALMSARGVIRDFPWLPFTTLAHAFADHHFLYHVILIPFVAALGPLVGVKVATVLLVAACMTAFFALLSAWRVPYPEAFTLILATSTAFLFRINLSKTSAASVAVLLLGLLCIEKRKPALLAALAFAYVWLYGGWPLLPVVAGAFAVGRVCADLILQTPTSLRAWIRTDEARNVAAVAAGAASGVVVNPYFPTNIRFYWEQIVQIALLNYRDKIGVGSEWYPYQVKTLFAENSAILLVAALAIALLVAMVFWNDISRRDAPPVARKDAATSFALFLLAGLFLLMTMRSRRHIEYFAPFAMLAAARFIGILHARLDARAFAARLASLFPAVPRFDRVFLAYFVFLALFLGARGVIGVHTSYFDGIPWTRYEKAGRWLAAHTPKNAVVFHSDWDDFPPLFFWDDRNRYIAGLDPTFLYRQDRTRYREWVGITTGKTKKDVANIIERDFDSRMVLVAKTHEEMREVIEADPAFIKVYEDDDVRIYSRL